MRPGRTAELDRQLHPTAELDRKPHRTGELGRNLHPTAHSTPPRCAGRKPNPSSRRPQDTGAWTKSVNGTQTPSSTRKMRSPLDPRWFVEVRVTGAVTPPMS